jgi:hypothetical protein
MEYVIAFLLAVLIGIVFYTAEQLHEIRMLLERRERFARDSARRNAALRDF